MLLSRLKQDTHDFHRNVESALDLFGRADALPRYASVLSALLSYYAPLEDRLATALQRGLPTLADSAEFDFTRRRKAALLRQDLARLGRRDCPPPCPATLLPQLANGAQALGCLYVLEGATLGGAVIARHFAQRFGLDADRGLAFHSAYGAATRLRWQEFREFASRHSAWQQGTDFDDQAVAGARDTFHTLSAWLRLALDKTAARPPSSTGSLRAQRI